MLEELVGCGTIRLGGLLKLGEVEGGTSSETSGEVRGQLKVDSVSVTSSANECDGGLIPLTWELSHVDAGSGD